MIYLNEPAVEVKVTDIQWELRCSGRALDNWVRRNFIPVPLIHLGFGRAIRVREQDAERLATFMVLAMMAGPTAAAEFMAAHPKYVPNTISLVVGIAPVSIEMEPIRVAIDRVIQKARVESRQHLRCA